MNAWVLSGFGLNIAMVVMALAWAIARRVKNAECLDVASSVLVAVLVCFYAAVGPGDPLRKWLLAGMVTISSLRLASLLLLNIIRNHPSEGQRYRALREHFPKRPWLMFFGFSQYLAALITLLSVPFAVACSNPVSGLRGVEIAALIVWLAAISGDTVAKEPLRRFLANRSNSAPTPRCKPRAGTRCAPATSLNGCPGSLISFLLSARRGGGRPSTVRSSSFIR